MSTSEHFDGNGNLVERLVNNEDGTGVLTIFDTDGNVTSTENLTGLPIPVPPEPSETDRLADLEAVLEALLEP